jgi:hypothetical protein
VSTYTFSTVGVPVLVTRAPSDANGLRCLPERLDEHGHPVHAAIESMNPARFMHGRPPDSGLLKRAGQLAIRARRKIASEEVAPASTSPQPSIARSPTSSSPPTRMAIWEAC